MRTRSIVLQERFSAQAHHEKKDRWCLCIEVWQQRMWCWNNSLHPSKDWGCLMRLHNKVGVLIVLVGAASARPNELCPDDQKAIQGSWDVVEQLPDAVPNVKYQSLVFKDGKLTFHAALGEQKTTVSCEFKLDPAKTPKHIDFTVTEREKKGNTYSGLYEFKDGQLKICYRGPGSTRPKDFSDKQDGTIGTVFLVLKPSPKK